MNRLSSFPTVRSNLIKKIIKKIVIFRMKNIFDTATIETTIDANSDEMSFVLSKTSRTHKIR